MTTRGRQFVTLFAVASITSCAPNYPALSMDATQIKTVSDDTICGTMACSGKVTPAMGAEMSRRHLSCLNITYSCTTSDPSIRSSSIASLARGGSAIVPIADGPMCNGAPPPGLGGGLNLARFQATLSQTLNVGSVMQVGPPGWPALQRTGVCIIGSSDASPNVTLVYYTVTGQYLGPRSGRGLATCNKLNTGAFVCQLAPMQGQGEGETTVAGSGNMMLQ
jgi:hypothetical protein